MCNESRTCNIDEQCRLTSPHANESLNWSGSVLFANVIVPYHANVHFVCVQA